ncbi:MAG: hypothetical protein ABI356_03030 [Steroidobacteraceae bacterium]
MREVRLAILVAIGQRHPAFADAAYVNSMSRLELRRAHVIKENEWADHLPSCGGLHAAHDEAAEIALPRFH